MDTFKKTIWVSKKSAYDRLKETALDFTVGLPCSNLKLVWDDFGMSEEKPEINIEVWVKADNPKPNHRWRYVGDISTKIDLCHADMMIFGELKSVRCALQDLLTKGNFSHDGRRGRKL